MSASSFIRIAAGFALFLALAVSARGDGIEVPFFTMKGEVGVADLKLAGIGSGSAPARTWQGPLVVKPSDVRMQPDGF
ncbi:MAG: hypothetical protein HY303_14990, partial [Candidatus Wallbacteria bacterium]|nr:hypothetical protein [Candidatus Wallbacteria bacterium]